MTKHLSKPGIRLKTPLLLLLCVVLSVAAFCLGRFLPGRETGVSQPLYADIMRGNAYGDVTYVVGHKSPDTDTVVSAITYANLKNRVGVNCEPAVSGKINNETKFVLDYFGVPVPEILENAAEKAVILVDHSAYAQSVDGMEQAQIAELLDHHGLGGVTSAQPLYVKAMAVGSTATIVYTSYLESGVAIDKPTAGLLTCAILSDTNNLTSSTVTDIDRKACASLAKIAGIKDIDAFYREMREHALSYEGMTDREIFLSDYKEYEMGAKRVGIACVNADGDAAEPMCRKMTAFMEEYLSAQEMDHLYVMVYDAAGDRTLLLYCGDGSEDIVKAAFGEPADGRFVITPSASRKKDVVPPLQEAYSMEE